MKPTFEIFGRLALTGEWMFCFTWCRDAEAGIARAKREAPRFGYDLVEFEARPVAN